MVCNVLCKREGSTYFIQRLFAVISGLVSNKIFHSETATGFLGIVTFSVLRPNFS